MSIHVKHRAPLVGVSIGIAAGIVARAFSPHKGVWNRVPVMQPLTPALNLLKQIEMKGSLKYASALLPAAIATAVDQEVHIPPLAKVARGTVTSLGLALTFAHFRDALGLRCGTFNASGHILMATVLSWHRALGLEHVSNHHSTQAVDLAGVACWVYAATDALFLFNTVACFHSIADTIGGIALGTVACGAGYFARERGSSS